MKVEIRESDGQYHVITSENLRLIGEWFSDKARLIMSANTHYDQRRTGCARR